jgi:polyhydroxybutyrate depolymerase
LASASAATTTSTTTASAKPEPVRSHLWFSAKSAEAPLMMFLHGYGSSPAQAARTLRLRAIADELDVHVVVPAGTPDSEGLRFWRASDACCDFDGTGIDDVASLTRLLKRVTEQHQVSRTIVVGFSNGAFMAHRLACDASDVVDGFAAFAGVGPANAASCKPGRPLPMLQIHGTADKAVRYEGGFVLGRKDVARHPGAVATTKFWADHNQCGPPTSPPPPHAIADRETSVMAFSDCAKGAPVALWTVKGGGHLIGIDRPTVEAAIRFLLGRSRP